MNNAAQSIPQTILEQLGNGTLAMLGAQNILSDATGVRLQIRGSRKANRIHIDLDLASDTYTVTFHKVRGLDVREVASLSGVYADCLHAVIESNTDLRTRL